MNISPTSIWRYFYPHREKESLNFFEMKRPHSMWHGDVLTGKRLSDGTFVYQCSIEDDYSRAYAGCLSKHKDGRIVVLALIDAILKWKSIPTVFHYDNGGEAKCGLVQTFLKNLSKTCNHEITFVPTKVKNPQGNGKKERAHKDDRRDFWRKTKDENLNCLRKKFKDYLHWRNNKKGHWALKGKPSITRLQENKKAIRTFTREELEILAKARVGDRLVRAGGMIFFNSQFLYTDERLVGFKVELWETLNGLEIRYKDKVFDTIEDYWEKP